jgi:hypothetical protein
MVDLTCKNIYPPHDLKHYIVHSVLLAYLISRTHLFYRFISFECFECFAKPEL